MKKSFASTLRTAQQREDKGYAQQSDDVGSRRVSKPETKPDQGKCVRDDTPSSGEIEGCGNAAKTEQLSQSQTDQSDDEDSRSQDGDAMQPDVPTELVRVGDQVAPSQEAPVTSSVLSANDLAEGVSEDALPRSSRNNGIAGGSTAPVLVTAEPEEPVTATTEETDQAPALPQRATVPLAQQGQAVTTTQPMQETNESPLAEPVIKAVDHETGKQSETSAQEDHSEKQAASVQPSTEGGKQASHVAQELSRLDAAGPQPARLVEQPAQQKQADPAAHPHRDPHAPLPSPNVGGEERAGKSMAIAPHGVQAVSGSGQHSNLLWSNQDERQSGAGEHPWAAPTPMASAQSDLLGDRSSQSMTASSTASPQPRPVDSRPASLAGPASVVASAHDIEPFVPTMSRSVVFEIAEPDLGRIHIRVAMTNELVHAHLSSDRSDVGQVLFNGQDRLQSALQSNGLEMGQFRVDIDRQSAGRSFQQGPSQDQNRMWQQPSNEGPREAGFFERHDETRLPYAGRLNLVA